MPDSKTVKDYIDSVPNDFLFTVKAPNSITLIHYYLDNLCNPYIRK
ncbi:DUF72 domain-containing protein [Planctomycetota bacterium]